MCLVLDLLPPPHQGWGHGLPVLGGGHQVPVQQEVGELHVLGVELETKVIQRFPKISQLQRRSLLGHMGHMRNARGPV